MRFCLTEPYRYYIFTTEALRFWSTWEFTRKAGFFFSLFCMMIPGLFSVLSVPRSVAKALWRVGDCGKNFPSGRRKILPMSHVPSIEGAKNGTSGILGGRVAAVYRRPESFGHEITRKGACPTKWSPGSLSLKFISCLSCPFVAIEFFTDEKRDIVGHLGQPGIKLGAVLGHYGA